MRRVSSQLAQPTLRPRNDHSAQGAEREADCRLRRRRGVRHPCGRISVQSPVFVKG